MNDVKPVEQFKIPEPFRAWCHECNIGFMTIEDLEQHVKDKHRVWKG